MQAALAATLRPAYSARLATWLLPALAALIPLTFLPGTVDLFQTPKLALAKIGLALALLALAAGASFDVGVFRTPTARTVLVFLGVLVVATLAALVPVASFFGIYGHNEGFLILAVTAAFFFVAANWVRDEAALTRLVAGLTIAGAVASLLAGAQVAGFDPFEWNEGIADRRLGVGTIGHANSLAEFLSVTIPLTAWLAWRGRGLERDLSLWALLFEIAALILTQTRTAWAAIAAQAVLIGPLLLGLRLRRTRWLIWPIAFAPLVLSLILVLGLLLAPMTGRGLDVAASGLLRGERGNPIESRQLLWRSGLAMVADHPILGWGPGLIELVYPSFRSPDHDDYFDTVGGDSDLHNVLLNISAQAGLLGLVAYFAVQVAVVVLLVRLARAPTASIAIRGAGVALLLAWVSLFVLFMFGKPHVTTDWLTWVLAGVGVGLTLGERVVPWQPAGRAWLAPLIAAVLLFVDAGSSLAADLAYSHGSELAEDSAGAAAPWLGAAVVLRPIEPVYHHELGGNTFRLARTTNDPDLYRQAYEQVARASVLLGNRHTYLLADAANAASEWEQQIGGSGTKGFDYIERAIAVDPLSPLPYATGAELALRLRQTDLARQYWARGRDRARSSDAFERLGRVAIRLGDPEAARASFKEAATRAWRSEPQVRLYRFWGDAALAAGLPSEAVDAYRQSLTRDPSQAGTRLKMAEALAATGARQQALQEAQAALTEAPSSTRAAELVEQLSRP